MAHKVTWHDAGREPQCAPNPAYPQGIAVDVSMGVARTCEIPLPYPARRCGHFRIECLTCGLRIAISTAGRPDDPRSVRMACKTVFSQRRN